jgi:hypothetical protein
MMLREYAGPSRCGDPPLIDRDHSEHLRGARRLVDPRGSLVEVEARFDKHGHLTPLALKWQGRWMPITPAARAPNIDCGPKEVRYYTVSAPREAMFELAFEPATMQWRIVPGRAMHMAA